MEKKLSVTTPIAVIIPTYNEKDNIANVIKQIHDLRINASIVIVDDNSPDGTRDVVLKLTKKHKDIFLLSRKKKQGRGNAVIAGFRFALMKTNAQYFFEMDADLSHDPQEIPKLLKYSHERIVVIASRYLKKSKIVNATTQRRILSFLSNKIITLILKLPMHDKTNGFRCYPRSAISLLINHNFISHGHITLSESAYFLQKHGYTFTEVPSLFIDRRYGKSTVTYGSFLQAFQHLLLIRKTLG